METTGTSTPTAPLRVPRRGALALLLAVALGATLLIATLLWSARADALRAAQVTALNYARTLEVRLDATFRRADAVLQMLATSVPLDALEPGGADLHGAALNAELDAARRAFDEVIALRITDASGQQLYVSNAAATPTANYADRAFFRRYLEDPAAGLQFSEVLQGRITRRPVVVISRPIRDTAGRFRGTVLAPLDLGFFRQQFAKLDVGRSGVVFLRRSEDGRLMLRWPEIESEINRPMPPDQVILVAVRSGLKEAVNEYTAFTDGVRRISGTVVVEGYPFFLTVALSHDDVLAPWKRQAALTALVWALLLLVLAALAWRLQRSDGQRRRLEAQLREAQRIESLGTLAGGIAHDFNNIVAAILGNAALARDDLPPQHPARRSLEQISRAGARARDLVQQIMAFGRRHSHALVAQPLQPLLEETAALLQPTLPPGTTLECRCPPEPLHARVDAAQMQQVLTNLCTNARHALAGRGGHITLGLEAVEPADIPPHVPGHAPGPAPEPSGRQLHLWVQDDGVGMPAHTLARIFEPFFTTRPVGEGTGLGLPVVHGIVVAHGGRIHVDSMPGAGTTVHLWFPAVEPDATPETATSLAAPTSAAGSADDADPAPPAGHGQRVLYVDDDEIIVLMVDRLLAQAGYRVRSCRSADAALAVLRTDPHGVDLLITDHNMPGRTGLELAREAAALRPQLPIVISSGYITDTLRSDAAAAGVRHLLQKQHTLEELAPLVRSLLAPR
ncbi:ATP-binding protein [Rubrivivax sp. RP6-9]|uniref:ATP-binding protein n=1 Tax=Rubrivivax sp. RP6-9 TaxID=3415750 RepID=UPI003CC67CFC